MEEKPKEIKIQYRDGQTGEYVDTEEIETKSKSDKKSEKKEKGGE